MEPLNYYVRTEGKGRSRKIRTKANRGRGKELSGQNVHILKDFSEIRLHSIILNYNYFVYNSVDKLLIFIQFEFNG